MDKLLANLLSSRELHPDTDKLLRDAWGELFNQLQQAREAIDNKDLFVPPASDRNLAEGYRYLLGYVYASFERVFFEDINFPYFRRAIPPVSKSTIDNADNLYLSARIDGNASYRISGRAYHHGHWQSTREPSAQRLAPQYVIFTAITQYSGDPGAMAGAGPKEKSDTGMLDTYDLQIADDGYFEIVLAAEKPNHYNGNFISTFVRKPVADELVEFTANYLICRQLFGDWSKEYPLELHIEKIDGDALESPVLTPQDAANKMRKLGRLVNNQMRYWNEFYVKLLNPYGDQSGSRRTFQKRNDLNPPMFTQADTGGQSTNSYSSGIYDLNESEALIIEDHIPQDEPPVYSGFNLSNYWGESYDYEHAVSSLNDFQARADSDGVVRYVIAHRDPGVANWLDTTGHAQGYMSRRWTYHQPPSQLPKVKVTKIKLVNLMQHLPADTRCISPDQRDEQIRQRRRHVRQRYRQS